MGHFMTLEEFRAVVEQLRAENPILFELESDPPATDAEIQRAEEQLKSSLPEQYRSFVKEFGAGFFAFGNVLSVKSGSEWDIVNFNQRNELIGGGFVAVSDPHTGNLYGFKCEAGVCRPEVWGYDIDDRAWARTEFNDLFEFLHRRALNA
jgi:uncharacterized protein YdcH (DUF465 family)